MPAVLHQGASGFGACSGNRDPNPEVCDCKDNDCDGAIDDFEEACGSCPGGVCHLPCRTGTRHCTCVPKGTACTTDADCEGSRSDPSNPGVPAACIKSGPGAGQCGVGTYSACSSVGPAATDPCDGIDNDGDGVIDDGAGHHLPDRHGLQRRQQRALPRRAGPGQREALREAVAQPLRGLRAGAPGNLQRHRRQLRRADRRGLPREGTRLRTPA